MEEHCSRHTGPVQILSFETVYTDMYIHTYIHTPAKLGKNTSVFPIFTGIFIYLQSHVYFDYIYIYIYGIIVNNNQGKFSDSSRPFMLLSTHHELAMLQKWVWSPGRFVSWMNLPGLPTHLYIQAPDDALTATWKVQSYHSTHPGVTLHVIINTMTWASCTTCCNEIQCNFFMTYGMMKSLVDETSQDMPQTIMYMYILVWHHFLQEVEGTVLYIIWAE